MKRVRLASGIELETLDLGPCDAPALIFLHGFPESLRTWRHQIAHLSGRYRCVAPNQRGYAGSSKPPEVSSYTADHLIADVVQLADALGIAKFTIVGHDWGGVIAWGVAAFGQHHRVGRAVILNAPHPTIFQKLRWLDPAQRQASQYTRVFCDTANDFLVRDYGLGGILAKAVDWQRPMPAMETEEQYAQMAQWQDRDAAFAMLNWYRASPMGTPAMDEPYAMPAGVQETVLPKLTIPTLVIWGMEDEALLPANLDGLDQVVDDLEIVQVPESGHFVTWEAPDAVNAALDTFLTRTD